MDDGICINNLAVRWHYFPTEIQEVEKLLLVMTYNNRNSREAPIMRSWSSFLGISLRGRWRKDDKSTFRGSAQDNVGCSEWLCQWGERDERQGLAICRDHGNCNKITSREWWASFQGGSSLFWRIGECTLYARVLMTCIRSTPSEIDTCGRDVGKRRRRPGKESCNGHFIADGVMSPGQSRKRTEVAGKGRSKFHSWKEVMGIN